MARVGTGRLTGSIPRKNERVHDVTLSKSRIEVEYEEGVRRCWAQTEERGQATSRLPVLVGSARQIPARNHVIPIEDANFVCSMGNQEVDVDAAFVPSSEMIRMWFGSVKHGAINLNHRKRNGVDCGQQVKGFNCQPASGTDVG